MAQQTMYAAAVNSPQTELAAAITASATTITLVDASKLPTAPNLLTIGSDTTAETVRYTAINGNALTVVRGFQGAAKSWSQGTKVARYYTAYDHDAFVANIREIDSKLGKTDLSTPLMQGVNVISTEMASALTASIMGNTISNVMGDKGTIKDSNSDGIADGWTKINNFGNRTIVNGKQRISALPTDTDTSRGIYTNVDGLVVGKNYVFVVNVDIESNASFRMMLSDNVGANIIVSNSYQTSGSIFVKFTPTVSLPVTRLWMYNFSQAGTVNNVEIWDVGIYEVSDPSTYTALGTTITEANVRDYFPHIDGTKHTEGMRIVARSKNIFNTESITYFNPNQVSYSFDPIEAVIRLERIDSAAGVRSVDYSRIPIKPNTNYTLRFTSSIKSGSNIDPLVGVRIGEKYIGDMVGVGVKSKTFNSEGNNYLKLTFRVAVNSTDKQVVEFSNIQLEQGTVATAYEPPTATTVELNTTLAKVGSIADKVYWRDGWRKWVAVQTGVKVDASRPITNAGVSTSEIDVIAIHTDEIRGMDGNGDDKISVIKYNMMPLTNMDTAVGNWNFPDLCRVAQGKLYISISKAESGWKNEITNTETMRKILLNGWKATANDGAKYTAWQSILTGTAAQTQTEAYVTANKAPNWTAWASLDYALAQPYELPEPLSLAGLALHEGANQIEIETGFTRNEQGEVTRIQSASVVDATGSYVTGIGGVLSQAIKDIADNQAQDQRQEEDINFVDAYSMNNRVDLDAHIADLTSHVHFVTAESTANAYKAPLNTKASGYVKGMAVAVEIDKTNTGASSLNINGWGAIPLRRSNGTDAIAGTFKAGLAYTFRLVNGNFILQGEGVDFGTAISSDVLAGKTIGTENGVVNGSMTNNGVYSVTPSTFDQAIPQGYTANGSVVKGDPDLVASNVRVGKDIFGVVGNLIEATGDAVAADVLAGKTFSKAGQANIAGSMPNRGAPTITPSTSNQSLSAGYYTGGMILGDADLLAKNIRSGVNLFGVVGSLIEGMRYVRGVTTSGSRDVRGLPFMPKIVIVAQTARKACVYWDTGLGWIINQHFDDLTSTYHGSPLTILADGFSFEYLSITTGGNDYIAFG